MMEIEKYQEAVITIYPKLLRMAGRFVRGDEVEDMVQETLIRLWLARDRWENYQNIESVAVTTLKHIFIDHQRKKRLEYEQIEDKQVVNPEKNALEHIESKDTVKQLVAIIQQLPALQQLIIRLKDLEGYEIEEIVKITQSSPDSVRMNLSRARKKVRETYLSNLKI